MLSKVLAFTTLLAVSTSIVALPISAGQERAACADVVVHYARGTFEGKPIGGVIGQTFESSLAQALGPAKSLDFEGVDYSADVLGFFAGGDTQGSATLAASVVATAGSCPDSKIVMAGYSQGAQLVHNAAGQLAENIQQRVAAVITFGDPKSTSALPPILEGRRKTFCHDGDKICTGSFIITTSHTTYAEDAPAAVAFVVAHV